MEFKTTEEKIIKRLILKAKKKAERRKGKIEVNHGALGIFGWYVVVPPILGGVLGVFLDKEYDVDRGIVISLVLLGLFMGLYNAYRWVKCYGILKNRKAEKEQMENITLYNKKSGPGEKPE